MVSCQLYSVVNCSNFVSFASSGKVKYCNEVQILKNISGNDIVFVVNTYPRSSDACVLATDWIDLVDSSLNALALHSGCEVH